MASQDDINRELREDIDELKAENAYLKSKLGKAEKGSLVGNLETGEIANPINALIAGITKIGDGFKDLSNISSRVFIDIRKAATDAAAQFGTGLKNYESISQEIAKALPDLTRLGFETSKIGEMQERFTEKIGTNVVLSADALKNIGILDKLEANGTAIALNFRNSAQSVSGMVDELNVAGQVAGDYGVNASKIFKDIETTMQTTNQYRFENGVEGISRMAAQTAIMGISFEKVVNFADTVMNPQGAIDAVAAFQRLGVTVSGLQDPFKLMYMAQSDLEGLTEEIGKSVSNLATFNKETGKLEIPPSARMQMKEIGDTLKFSEEEMNKLVSQQAKFNAMAGDFEGLGVSEEDKMMIANLAEFSKDRQQFEVKVGGETKAVTELNSEDLEILKERPKNLEDAAMQQLDYVTSINKNVEAILKAGPAATVGTKAQFEIEKTLRAGGEVSSELFTESIKSLKFREETDKFTKEFSNALTDIIGAVRSGDLKKLGEITENLGKLGQVNLEDALNRFEVNIGENLLIIPDKLKEKLGNDNIYEPITKGVMDLYDLMIKNFKTYVNIKPPTNTEAPQSNFQAPAQTTPLESAQRNIQIEPPEETTVNVKDFVIKALPEDTIKVIGGTNIPPAGADITNILNNQTNNTQALTSIQPIAPREIITPQVQANATPVANEQKELRVKFDPFIVKLEGDGKSIEMALQDNVVRDKIIDMVGKAMTSDYNTMGRPILGVRS